MLRLGKHRDEARRLARALLETLKHPAHTLSAFCAASLLLAGCVNQGSAVRPVTSVDRAAIDLAEARSIDEPVEIRITRYCEAADLCERELEKKAGGKGIGEVQAGTGQSGRPGSKNPSLSPQSRALEIYDAAAAEVTILLRQARDGKYWDRDEEVSDGTMAYRIRFNPGVSYGIWDPSSFTDFQLTRRRRPLRLEVVRPGWGGTLVGRQSADLLKEPFAPKVGYRCAVTAALDFASSDRHPGTRIAKVTLYNPVVRNGDRMEDFGQPIAYDLTAPLTAYPRKSVGVVALRGLLRPDTVSYREGLYLLEPYDPNRIPVVLVHGLVSVPHMWLNVVNEMRADPDLRRHYQFWVFYYPTANPIVLSALTLRQDLAKAEQLYHPRQGIILVGHSMGGLVSRMQATDTGEVLWDTVFGQQAESVYQTGPVNSEARQALIFKADPNIKRIVFICVPHRGSYLASSFIGSLGNGLIRAPARAIQAIENSFTSPLSILTGVKNLRIPTSINGLSPRSPVLAGLDKLPIKARYHSIIGDRGRGNSPNSSDGVVPYWSSHLEGAESEKIIPTGHGGYQSPGAIAELKRILHVHLEETDSRDNRLARVN
jgi:pimeloyl-ACP methyl ester carboxylesterase